MRSGSIYRNLKMIFQRANFSPKTVQLCLADTGCKKLTFFELSKTTEKSMTDKIKKVAIYTRVSTKDKKQDVVNQLIELREYCREQGYKIFEEYSDNESGKKGRGERIGFDRMFKDASRKRFDLVLFWSLDRFTREGIANWCVKLLCCS